MLLRANTMMRLLFLLLAYSCYALQMLAMLSMQTHHTPCKCSEISKNFLRSVSAVTAMRLTQCAMLLYTHIPVLSACHQSLIDHCCCAGMWCSPYHSMFGPDKCGATDKVHFILQHRNPVSGMTTCYHTTNHTVDHVKCFACYTLAQVVCVYRNAVCAH
jgi:Calreticulin family